MAKAMKPTKATRKLPARQPVPKGTDRSPKATGTSIFQKADNGNRKLGRRK